MDWAEVKKINSDFKEPLDVKLAVLKLLIEEIKTATGSATVDLSDIIAAVGGIKTDVAAVKTAVGTVNTNVDSVKTTVGTVNTTVGTVNTNVNTANTNINSIKTTVGTVNTNVSSILTAVNSIKTAGTVPAVKSVQRGNFGGTGDGLNSDTASTKTITISSVNLSKSVLLMHGGTTSISSNGYKIREARPYLSSATVITVPYFLLNASSQPYFGTFIWQVIEFY